MGGQGRRARMWCSRKVRGREPLCVRTVCAHAMPPPAIDHIRWLLGDRDALLSRLQRARQVLGEGHPALVLRPEYRDVSGVPLWDREWTGGTGIDDGADDEDGDDFGGSEGEG